MQDPETPPAEEGETDGGAVGVRLIVAVSTVVIVNSTAASTPPPWTTVIAPLSAAME